MAGSTFGKTFKITTWGESHGPALGVVIDGVPSNLELCEDDIQCFLDRRKPGQSAFTTQRNEDDKVEILSGVFEGKTTGTPISLMIRNKDHHSADYSEIASYYRPGHADYTFDEKFGFRDYRGGGRSSGRETAARVAAGAIAIKLLKELGIEVCAYTKSIGPVVVPGDKLDMDEAKSNSLYMPDKESFEAASSYLKDLMAKKDSSGGTIECIVKNLPSGVGEPVFDKLDANIAKAVMSIGSVKAVEIGDGIKVSSSLGSDNNDSFIKDGDKVIKQTNHAGGVLGGISDGSTLKLTAHIKPTPSIASTQKTVDKDGNEIEISIKGRHDPVIVPRAVVVVESMVAITILDALFESMHSNLDNVKKIIKK